MDVPECVCRFYAGVDKLFEGTVEHEKEGDKHVRRPLAFAEIVGRKRATQENAYLNQ